MTIALSEHLPLLTSAPNGIQKLRGLILELAVRGKLVPQDESDDPASELLERIAKERALLEAAGSLKKSKAIPVVGDEEKLFDTPIGWEWARLATIGNIFNGNSINSNEKEAKFRRKDGLPYIATKDVGYGLTPLDYDNGICIPESEPNFKIAHEGAVFICAEGGSAGKKCGITNRNVFFGNKLFANETFAGIPPRLVLYLYLSPFFREQFVAAMTGIIGGVSIAKFIEIAIPIPPLAEQHHIVAKVDELMALCDRLEAEQSDAAAAHERLVATLLGTLSQSTDAADLAANWQRLAEHFETLFTTEASLDALKQTILQLAVMGKLVPQDPNDEPVDKALSRSARAVGNLKVRRGVPTEVPTPKGIADQQLPKSWHTLSVAQLLHLGAILDLKDGNHGANHPKVAEFTEAGLPFITAAQVREDGSIDYDGAYKVSGKVLSRLRVGFSHPDDVIYTHKGSVGRVAIANRDCILTPQTTYYRTNRNFIASAYLAKFLRSRAFRDQVDSVKGQTTRDFVAISAQYEFFINLPPLAEQHRIVAKVDELLSLVDRLKADLAESRAQQERLATTLIETALKAA